MTDDLKAACNVLRNGGLILYPTDTVWGIGCDATCAEAVERIYVLKRRADRKAMLVLLDSAARLETCVEEVPAIARELLEVAVTPLTIIYSKARTVAPNLPGEDGSLGIRITNELYSGQLCQMFRRPVVSTSANLSGQPSPATFREIAEEIRAGVDYVVRYRQDDTRPARPSGILRIGAGGLVQVIRE
ncbi:MAG: threonylcarbamoyl-AMP synthase [Tannerella sp.]|nr:threonylcarbamoyl-AMP synthase [Tannerella sp.]